MSCLKDTMYYVMVCVGEHPVKPIGQGPDFFAVWRDGCPISETVPEPLVYTLSPDYPGSPKAMYYEKSIPVMREDVINVLMGVGVNNIQFFDAIIYDPVTNKRYDNYKAYNIIGLVACADMLASELMKTSESLMTDTDFHALVIDESKTNGMLLFRLAENVSAIIVHKKVKNAIEAENIPGFIFYGPGEWAG
jgi:hypothetical protein